MISKEEIEKALNNLWCSVTDVMFNVLYSQKEMQADLKIVLNEFKQLYNRNIKLEQENKKLNKMINEMSGYISNTIACPLEVKNANLKCESKCGKILEKECWKQYFEKKVEEE